MTYEFNIPFLYPKTASVNRSIQKTPIQYSKAFHKQLWRVDPEKTYSNITVKKLFIHACDFSDSLK